MSKNIAELIDMSTDHYFITGHHNRHELMSAADLDDSNNTNDDIIKNMINLIAKKNTGKIYKLLRDDKKNELPHMTDQDDETFLHFSVFSDSYKLTKLFLKYGSDPHKRDNEGQTPLFRVVFGKNTRIIKLLLHYGAEINAQDHEGNTALHLAVLSKNYTIVKSLLSCGINPLTQNNYDLSPLDFAVSISNNKMIIDKNIMEIFSQFEPS